MQLVRFPRLLQVVCFPALSTRCMVPLAWPALKTSSTFSRAMAMVMPFNAMLAWQFSEIFPCCKTAKYVLVSSDKLLRFGLCSSKEYDRSNGKSGEANTFHCSLCLTLFFFG